MAIFSELENYYIFHSLSSILEIVNFATSGTTVSHTVSSDDASVQITSHLYPKGSGTKEAHFVYINLNCIKILAEYWLLFNVSLLDVKKKKHFTNYYGKAFCHFLENKAIYSRFCHRDDILASPDTLLHKGTLKVQVEVAVLKQRTSAPLPPLSTDFASLLANGSFSDVTLVVGKRDFPVHKTILSARSPVFARMFAGKFKESKESRVVLEESDEQAFTELLNYIYTGRVDNLPENASELLIAAEKYQIESLRDFCGHYLASTLTTDNLLSHLQLAYLHNATQLQGRCLEYFDKHLRKVKLTENWKQLITVKSDVNQELLGLLLKTVMAIE